MTADLLLVLAIAAPASVAVVLGVFGRRLPYAAQGGLAVLGTFTAFAAILALTLGLDSLLGFAPVAWYGGDWILTEDLQAAIVLYFDSLSLLMSLLVTGFGGAIVLYSVQYMDHEEDTSRFFASISLFIAAMMLLVLGENLFLLFIGWEGVGLASYLLIGHYWKTDFAPPAAMRAFFVNRVGDMFFMIGVFLLFQATGTVSLPAMAREFQLVGDLANSARAVDPDLLQWAALFLLGGIFGKSAQVPLHVWLPDAMAGPTPVSALIHAATMVTSGIYLMTRLDWLYALAPAAMQVVFYASLATLLIGSTLACLQSDIKKVLAYSTLAHLALMFLAVSAGDSPAGMMHLFGHASFKALLFLAAGSVIYFQHHEQDLGRLRGVLKHMPITRAAFWVGAIGAAGFLPFASASFFSKDLVMHAIQSGHGAGAYWLVFLAELLGVVYMFRLLGYLESSAAPAAANSAPAASGSSTSNAAGGGDHSLHSPAPESGWIIRGVLLALTIFAPIFGWLSASPGFGGSGMLYALIAKTSTMPEPALFSIAKNVSSGLVIAGLVFWLYRKSGSRPEVESKLAQLSPVQRNYFFDDAYRSVILRPLELLARLGYGVLEGPLFTGMLRQTGAYFQHAARGLRVLQSGSVNQYALFFMVLLTAILGVLGAVWLQ
ncbi:MAG: NADH-quinone oxidoreductase subunit L [bacterium]|nr:NADH-quinone oxidoreductase subunit L [bacterium]